MKNSLFSNPLMHWLLVSVQWKVSQTDEQQSELGICWQEPSTLQWPCHNLRSMSAGLGFVELIDFLSKTVFLRMGFGFKM